jgi:hypothetical protein
MGKFALEWNCCLRMHHLALKDGVQSYVHGLPRIAQRLRHAQIKLRHDGSPQNELIARNSNKANPAGYTVYGVNLRTLACWDSDFEFRRGP